MTQVNPLHTQPLPPHQIFVRPILIPFYHLPFGVRVISILRAFLPYSCTFFFPVPTVLTTRPILSPSFDLLKVSVKNRLTNCCKVDCKTKYTQNWTFFCQDHGSKAHLKKVMFGYRFLLCSAMFNIKGTCPKMMGCLSFGLNLNTFTNIYPLLFLKELSVVLKTD
jgi:hypothetical protein